MLFLVNGCMKCVYRLRNVCCICGRKAFTLFLTMHFKYDLLHKIIIFKYFSDLKWYNKFVVRLIVCMIRKIIVHSGSYRGEATDNFPHHTSADEPSIVQYKASELVPCSLLPHWNSMRFFATVSLYE